MSIPSALRLPSLVAATLVLASSSFAQDAPPPFDWTSVEPTTDLRWVDCYQSPLQCTRLSVPLNYSAPDQGSAAIAVIRVPSPVADTDAYRGPILYNPGGPGGSGVTELVAGGGAAYLDLFGEEFDLVSFDPRGVNFSTPAIQLFDTPEATDAFVAKASTLLSLDPENWDTLPDRLEEMNEIGDRINANFGDTLKYATTDNVARDMLRIVEAYGREKIQYYGISYGTVLGATFASLFPDKIDRMIIDGVVDVPGYYSSDWTLNIADADATLEYFFSACAEAGERCAFGADSKEAVNERYDALLASLAEEPLLLPGDIPLGVEQFQASIHGLLYWPRNYAMLAQGLVAVEARDSETLALLVGTGAPQTAVGPLALAIRGVDAAALRDTQEDLQDYATRMREVTKYFPAAVEGDRLFSAGWKVNPDHFRGPIGSDNTSHPLLVIGNTYDPITPLAAAEKVSKLFAGSRLLQYDIPGHTSIAWNSPCILDHMRTYFRNGTLPEEGAKCEMTGDIFSADASEGPAGQGNGTRGGGRGGGGGGGGFNDDEEEDAALGMRGKMSLSVVALSAVLAFLL